MVPEAGQFVGPYEILGQIGAGGMGVVYRAWDERLHREVAVKLLRDEYETPNLRERFLIEARAASALNHPNICVIFDLGEQDGEPYLVMEMLTGQTVKERMTQAAPGTAEIVRIASETADALACAHAKGVIHRDIKPANIFLLNKPGGQSQAKVLDFGLAKVSMASRSGRAQRAIDLTMSGSTVGTLAYMSPEQARGEALDARSDLFSLGVVMYEMCTRRVPFRGATSALVFTALLTQSPEPIRTWNTAIPRDLERLILRLLAKDRAERFQTAHELFDALRRLTLKGEGDWLRKLPPSVVPLVPSVDPVARARRGWRSAADESGASGEAVAAELPLAEGDPDEHMLRPRRLPMKESGPRESAFGVAAPEDAEREPALPDKAAPSSADGPNGRPETPVEASRSAAPADGDERRRESPAGRPPLLSATRAGTARNGSDGPGTTSVDRVADAPAVDRDAVASSTATSSHPETSTHSASVARIIEVAAVAATPETAASAAAPGTAAETAASARGPSPAEPIAGQVRDTVDGQGAVLLVEQTAGQADRAAEPLAGTQRDTKVADPTREPMRSPRGSRPPAAARTGAVVAPERPSETGERSPQEPKEASDGSSRRWLGLAGIVVVLALAGLVVFQLHRGGLAGVVLRPGDAVLLTTMDNRTGERDLDHSIMEGLEIELAENSSLRFRGLTAFHAGARQAAAEAQQGARGLASQAIAERTGARAYVYGEIERSGTGYTLRINVVDARSNDRLAAITEMAVSRDQMAGAVTRLATALRKALGEGEAVGTHPATPLAQQATADMAALESYAEGRTAAEDGHAAEAAVAYRRAVALAPRFALAQVQLAWLSEQEGAEVEAAEAASAGAGAATRRMGDRVLQMALYTRQALADHDLTAATATARVMAAARPHDVQPLLAITRVMRLGGHRTEALLSAEQALRRDATEADAYNEEAHALIGLDRYGEALRVRSEAQKAGVACECGANAATYLSGGEPEPAAVTDDLARHRDLALALDHEGRFAEGLVAWKEASAAAQGREGMGSAAAVLMGQASLDRALAGRCAESVAAEQVTTNLVQGSTALFRRSVARALCGGETDGAEAALSRGAGLHSQAVEYSIPLLRAAVALHGREPMEALGALSHAREQRDANALAVYLRGAAHVADEQNELAAEDFLEIKRHRGEAFLGGSAVFTPSLAGLEQAQLAIKDRAGAQATHELLVQLSQHADRPVAGTRATGGHHLAAGHSKVRPVRH